MPNSIVMGVAIVAAFIIYITTRGELPQYLGVLFGTVTGAGTGGTGGSVSGALGTAQQAAGTTQQGLNLGNQLAQHFDPLVTGPTGTEDFGGGGDVTAAIPAL